MRKILFASSEVHPLIKTGGLADVSGSLPIALRQQGQDIRIIMPAYRKCLEGLDSIHTIATLKLDGFHLPIEILQSTLPDSDVTIWLVHSPQHFDREGGPYSAPSGEDWEDNAARFTLFSRAIAALSMNQAGLDWQPDILHCSDWQTGLAPALIADLPNRPATVFTIHNLAYQGLYSRAIFDALDLPDKLWHSDGLEFYGLLSLMKGGLIYADHITTVSPTYAKEICSYEFGYGLEGLLSLRAKQGRLSGILNGIDNNEWDPETDSYLSKKYTIKNIRNKSINKSSLQQYFGLPEKADVLLMGLISRLVSQKGIDLTLDAVTALLESGANIQLACLGSGAADYEQDLRILRARFPDKVGVDIGYNEKLAHQIEAGADVFLMPSRFEPCGLNQLYSLRYGTLPIVRNTGGLADTVVDATESNRKNEIATGFKFNQTSAEALEETIVRALDLFQRPRIWRKMMITAMEQNYSWEQSADTYLELYESL
ncbi:MAG: glycogen synthase GlgA [Pseudomonadota bacterium]|nr:glycogen synthase GlgA [Pseudomonadota bacterium]MDO7711538.1 glycogen synthase GlgA [Pseudomonadota bacterium]